MNRIISTAVMAAIFAVTSLCSAGESPFSDPSKTIEAEAASDISITLESNRTTGFGWDIDSPVDEKVLRFVSSEYIAPASGMMGSPGREIWNFRAVAPGRAGISFKYLRPWEKGTPPEKRCVFNIVVKPAKPYKEER